MSTEQSRAARWTLVATSFGLGMALLDVTAVNVAVPAIQANLHTDVRGLSWVIDGYTLAFASLLLLAGGLGDRIGARRIFVSGLVVFTIASALCAGAPGLLLLITARILQGIGAALFMPSSLAILRQAYPEAKERAQAIGIWSGLTAVAGASGPVLGGLMVSAFGWRSIFFLNLPLGVLAVWMAWRFVKPSPRSPGGGYDLLAQLTAAGSLALFTWALIERSSRGWGSPIIVGAIVASLAGLRAFVYLEGRSPRPILPLELFKDRTFSATASAALLYAGAFFGSVLVFSLFFQGVRGDSPAVAGLHLSAVTASFGLTSILAGRLIGRYGTRLPIMVGLIALSLSAWSAAVLPATAPFFMLLPALMLMGIGAGLVAPAMNAAILASVPPQLSGIGAG
ncbi:MAG TPA: MFS transporter, partial [Myxococcales bacterium]|nr:MFS transporter [Myxococcales bacterium]